MGQSKVRRLMVILMALVVTMSMMVPSFAATKSQQEGSTKPTTATVKTVYTSANYAKQTIKVSYTGKNAAKYKIKYRVAGGKWKTITTSNKKYYVIKSLKKGKLYQVKVAPVSKKGKVGKYSAVKYRYLAKVAPTVKSPKAKQVKVTWKKVKGATSYKVFYSRNSDMSNAKSVTVKGTKTSTTIKNLKKGKKYYVRVRPMKKYKGTTYAGMRSSIKSVKVKK